MNPVVHFEMPAGDKARMRAFYESAFGWKTNQLGSEMGNYVLVTTADTVASGMIQKPGQINGGFFDRSSIDAQTRITIEVEDIKAAMARVTQAGGKALGGRQNPEEPDVIPGVGLYATVIDTEGNMVSLLQPTGKT